MRFGTLVAIATCEKQIEVNDLMKIDMSCWAAFLLIGTDLLGRVTVQGVEPVLVSTVVEYGSAALNLLSKWVKDRYEIEE
jgi:hypothetical protein